MKKMFLLSLTCTLIFSGCSTKEGNVVVEESSFTTLEVANESNGYTLDGELVIPNETSNVCAVIITGSGPSDMDGTHQANTFYKDLAYALAENGVVSYRFNERSYQYNEELLEDIYFDIHDEYIEDTAEAVEMLKNSNDVECSKTFLIAHSMGAYLVPMINDYLDVDGYVMLAGNVSPLHHILVEQYEYMLGIDNVITEEEQEIIDGVVELKNAVDNINSYEDTDVVGGAYAPYWKSITGYDPIKKAQEINVPVLVMNGGKDYQVVENEFNQWKTIEKENWEFKFYDDLTHIFGVGAEIPSPNDYLIDQDIDEEFINDLVEWINRVSK